MNENRKNHIKQLLELYYDGNSSVTDENELHEYFNSSEADHEFEADRIIFEALKTDGYVDVPDELHKKLSDSIDSWEKAEKKERSQRSTFSIKPFRTVLNLAASIALLLGIGSLLFLKKAPQPVDTFTDPMEAYAETQRVLSFFANTLDKSLQGMEAAGRNQEKAVNLAIEQLNNL